MTADIGTYSGDLPITTTFVWQRCDATGANCHVIASAKKIVYFPTAADVGYTLRVAVTATNAYGKLVALSDPTDADLRGAAAHPRAAASSGRARATTSPAAATTT